MRPESRLAAKRFAAKIARKFSQLSTQAAPYAAAASAALILWHAARDTPSAAAGNPAPLIYPAGSVPAAPPPGAPAAAPAPQQATIASTVVIVGRNDTLDAIFRRMALDPADLAAIRNLPGIRQSLDFFAGGFDQAHSFGPRGEGTVA